MSELFFWCKFCEVEFLGKVSVGVDFFGKYAAGLGTASGGGTDHHGFADAAQPLQSFSYGMVFSGLLGASEGRSAGLERR